jgi:hypothetical protein
MRGATQRGAPVAASDQRAPSGAFWAEWVPQPDAAELSSVMGGEAVDVGLDRKRDARPGRLERPGHDEARRLAGARGRYQKEVQLLLRGQQPCGTADGAEHEPFRNAASNHKRPEISRTTPGPRACTAHGPAAATERRCRESPIDTPPGCHQHECGQRRAVGDGTPPGPGTGHRASQGARERRCRIAPAVLGGDLPPTRCCLRRLERCEATALQCRSGARRHGQHDGDRGGCQQQ